MGALVRVGALVLGGDVLGEVQEEGAGVLDPILVGANGAGCYLAVRLRSSLSRLIFCRHS